MNKGDTAPTWPAGTRRQFLGRSMAGGAALLAPGFPRIARAQDGYPNRAIRIVVNNAPGGVGDLTVRLVGQHMSEMFGQPVVIDNRGGAGGILAANQLLGAPADGYTLMTAGNATAVRPALFRSLPYDVQRDFASVSTMAFFPIGIVVSPDSPLRTAQDFIRKAKEDGRDLNIGTIAIGSTQHLVAEMFKATVGSQATTVPFSSTPQLLNALLRKDVDVGFEILAPVWSQMEDRTLRVLAVTQATRVPNLPDLPTLAESGLPGFDAASWNSIVARSGTAPEIVAKLSTTINTILNRPDVRKTLLDVGVEPRGSTPQDLDALTAKEMVRWREVIETAGIPKQ
ncbi:Bug family tripartite tricarboxylate transporter substrate binding protein [Roseomonas elaeocarpi]|uniref:Bug family tripartite tricarboxylate transporter substrate binding protein n=1 Tax=Roseomonas elaeocarpi TaxID=907779 RepID=A0ABV6JWS9_9PROT